MRLHRVSYYLITLFLIALGGLSTALPYSADKVRGLLEHPWIFFSAGGLLMVLGLALLTSLIIFRGKKCLKIKMEGAQTTIDEGIIQDYVAHYWKKSFPSVEGKPDIVLTGREKLQILASLPLQTDEERNETLLRVERELSVLLAHRLGYESDFVLTLDLNRV